ncbi:MAG: hypothetical protein R3F43_14180 [bacterium]
MIPSPPTSAPTTCTGPARAAAESAFAAFVERYGTHDYADNALFWIGQVQFDEARFQAALATFHRVVTEHPAGNKGARCPLDDPAG